MNSFFAIAAWLLVWIAIYSQNTHALFMKQIKLAHFEASKTFNRNISDFELPPDISTLFFSSARSARSARWSNAIKEIEESEWYGYTQPDAFVDLDKVSYARHGDAIVSQGFQGALKIKQFSAMHKRVIQTVFVPEATDDKDGYHGDGDGKQLPPWSPGHPFPAPLSRSDPFTTSDMLAWNSLFHTIERHIDFMENQALAQWMEKQRINQLTQEEKISQDWPWPLGYMGFYPVDLRIFEELLDNVHPSMLQGFSDSLVALYHRDPVCFAFHPRMHALPDILISENQPDDPPYLGEYVLKWEDILDHLRTIESDVRGSSTGRRDIQCGAAAGWPEYNVTTSWGRLGKSFDESGRLNLRVGHHHSKNTTTGNWDSLSCIGISTENIYIGGLVIALRAIVSLVVLYYAAVYFRRRRIAIMYRIHSEKERLSHDRDGISTSSKKWHIDAEKGEVVGRTLIETGGWKRPIFGTTSLFLSPRNANEQSIADCIEGVRMNVTTSRFDPSIPISIPPDPVLRPTSRYTGGAIATWSVTSDVGPFGSGKKGSLIRMSLTGAPSSESTSSEDIPMDTTGKHASQTGSKHIFESTPSGFSPSSATARPMTLKRDRDINNDDNAEEEEGKRPRSNKESSKKDSQEPGRKMWACPFAKGDCIRYKACIGTKRSNLTGIREHLASSHCGGAQRQSKKIPQFLSNARSWEALFHLCFPFWRGVLPYPYFTLLEAAEMEALVVAAYAVPVDALPQTDTPFPSGILSIIAEKGTTGDLDSFPGAMVQVTSQQIAPPLIRENSSSSVLINRLGLTPETGYLEGTPEIQENANENNIDGQLQSFMPEHGVINPQYILSADTRALSIGSNIGSIIHLRGDYHSMFQLDVTHRPQQNLAGPLSSSQSMNAITYPLLPNLSAPNAMDSAVGIGAGSQESWQIPDDNYSSGGFASNSALTLSFDHSENRPHHHLHQNYDSLVFDTPVPSQGWASSAMLLPMEVENIDAADTTSTEILPGGRLSKGKGKAKNRNQRQQLCSSYYILVRRSKNLSHYPILDDSGNLLSRSDVDGLKPQCFEFGSLVELRNNFDEWMRSRFRYPLFSWDLWQLKDLENHIPGLGVYTTTRELADELAFEIASIAEDRNGLSGQQEDEHLMLLELVPVIQTTQEHNKIQ